MSLYTWTSTRVNPALPLSLVHDEIESSFQFRYYLFSLRYLNLLPFLSHSSDDGQEPASAGVPQRIKKKLTAGSGRNNKCVIYIGIIISRISCVVS